MSIPSILTALGFLCVWITMEGGVTPLICRVGSKQRFVDMLTAMIPPHETYVEPFVGSGAVFFAKDPSKKEVLNDLSKEVIGTYALVKQVSSNPSDYPNVDSIQKARAFWKGRQSSKEAKLVRSIIGFCSGWMSKPVKTESAILRAPPLERRLKNIDEYKERLRGVILRNQDYEKVMREFDGKTTFFFCDPPYQETSKGIGYAQQNEFDFERFAKVCRGLKGKVLITINDSPSLREMFRGFHIQPIVIGGTGKKGTKKDMTTIGSKDRKELLISNYPLPGDWKKSKPSIVRIGAGKSSENTMPYKLRKAPKKDAYWVVNKETGKKHSKDPLPKERAEAQMRALYASESKEGGMYSPIAKTLMIRDAVKDKGMREVRQLNAVREKTKKELAEAERNFTGDVSDQMLLASLADKKDALRENIQKTAHRANKYVKQLNRGLKDAVYGTPVVSVPRVGRVPKPSSPLKPGDDRLPAPNGDGVPEARAYTGKGRRKMKGGMERRTPSPPPRDPNARREPPPAPRRRPPPPAGDDRLPAPNGDGIPEPRQFVNIPIAPPMGAPRPLALNIPRPPALDIPIPLPLRRERGFIGAIPRNAVVPPPGARAGPLPLPPAQFFGPPRPQPPPRPRGRFEIEEEKKESPMDGGRRAPSPFRPEPFTLPYQPPPQPLFQPPEPTNVYDENQIIAFLDYFDQFPELEAYWLQEGGDTPYDTLVEMITFGTLGEQFEETIQDLLDGVVAQFEGYAIQHQEENQEEEEEELEGGLRGGVWGPLILSINRKRHLPSPSSDGVVRGISKQQAKNYIEGIEFSLTMDTSLPAETRNLYLRFLDARKRELSETGFVNLDRIDKFLFPSPPPPPLSIVKETREAEEAVERVAEAAEQAVKETKDVVRVIRAPKSSPQPSPSPTSPLSPADAVSPKITEEERREMLKRTMTGSGRGLSVAQMSEFAKSAYSGVTRKTLFGYTLVRGTPTLKFYRKDKHIIVAVRGTQDKGDVDAWIPSTTGKMRSTARYQTDSRELAEFQKAYPKGEYRYTGVGHSLAGAILDIFLREGRINNAISFNPMVEPQERGGGTTHRRIYNNKDPLWMMFGSKTKGAEALTIADPLWKAWAFYKMPLGLSTLLRVYDAHTMKTLTGRGVADLAKLINEQL
jgi:DNA adenine methylase